MAVTKNIIKSKVIKYAELLGIGDYKYSISLVARNKLPKNDYDIYANVMVDDESREVYMQINRDLLKESPEEIDRTIIHELLHVRFAEMLSLFSLLCKHYVTDDKAKKMYISQINRHEHKIIAALATAMEGENNG